MSREVSKAVKSSTSTVKTLADALNRAEAIYLAGLKRLEAEYCERVKEATRELLLTEAAEERTEAAPTPGDGGETEATEQTSIQ
jgi:hypothetical protein